MKKIRLHSRKTIRITTASLLLLIAGCLEFSNLSQPERAVTDSNINITAELKVVPETDGAGRLVFAILAPKAWNLAQNASLTLTTRNYNAVQGSGPDVTDEALTLMPETELEPQTQTSWSEAFMAVKGLGDNTSLETPVELEWVVWRSSSSFSISDQISTDPVYADVKIQMKTGEDPVKCYLGYAYCYDGYGLKAGENRDASIFKAITTYETILSTTPSTFRYGDIFAVQISTKNTALQQTSEIYLCGKAVYNDGQIAEITFQDPQHNLMERISDKMQQKYIYPKEFFGLPADAVIEELRFYFTNADGSIVVQDGDQGFLVEQAAE